MIKEIFIIITLVLIIVTFLIVANGGLLLNKYINKLYKKIMIKTPW